MVPVIILTLRKIQTTPVPIVVVALLAPGRICNILEVEKTLSSVLVNWFAPALRFLLLQLCKEIEKCKYQLFLTGDKTHPQNSAMANLSNLRFKRLHFCGNKKRLSWS